MTQTTFTDNVLVQGSRDITQLDVKGNATQTTPLETWRDNAGNIKVQVTADGRLQIGNNLGSGAPADALIQANNDINLPSTLPLSGWHTLGRITGTLSALTNWVVHELQLLGTGGVSGLQTAMRAKLTLSNTGTSTSAELRGADVQTINQVGTSGARVGQVTGVRATVSNAASAYLDKASGVEAAITNDTGGNMNQASAFLVVPTINAGSIGTLFGLQMPDLTQGAANFALFTKKGLNQLGDQLAILGSADRPQLIVRANPTGQTTDLQQWQNSSGTPLSSVDATGAITLPNETQYRVKDSGGAARQFGRLTNTGTLAVGDSVGMNTLALFAGSSVASLMMNAAANYVQSNFPFYSVMNDAAGGTTRALTLRHTASSGTPGAFFGSSIGWEAHTNTLSVRNQTLIESYWLDATDATRRGQLVLYAYDATAARVGMVLTTDGTQPQIAFYGANAVAKQSVTGSRSGGVALTNLLTALANLGLITNSTTA